MTVHQNEWEAKLVQFLESNPPPRRGLRLIRAQMILEGGLCLWALRASGNNKAEGARMLGLLRTTYLEKLKRLLPVSGGMNGFNIRDQGHRT